MAKQIKDKEKVLDRKLNELMRENSSLKKKLGKLRKDVSKTHDVLALNQEYANQVIVEEKKKKVKKCENCLGEIKQLKIRNIIYEICQRCKSRKRLIVEKVEEKKPE